MDRVVKELRRCTLTISYFTSDVYYCNSPAINLSILIRFYPHLYLHTERLVRIKQRYVDRGSYFVINRGRQYGKTTTLRALAEYLKEDYVVFSLDFQEIGTAEFQNEAVFSKTFAHMCIEAVEDTNVENEEELARPLSCFIDDAENVSLRELFDRLTELCENPPKPVVLIIDEAYSALNNQVFLDFLAMLRGYYLSREDTPTFQSVIFAGVYDIRNLKLKNRPESEYRYNSPWNIAAEFNVRMSFSAEQIAGMLDEYEADNQTGRDFGSRKNPAERKYTTV